MHSASAVAVALLATTSCSSSFDFTHTTNDGASVPASAQPCALPTTSPEAVGLSRASLDSFAAIANDRMSDALVILRDGKLVGEWYFGQREKRRNIQSVTKAITSLGVALLLDDGRLPSLDLPLGDVFPEFARDDRHAVTLDMLLDHTSGIAAGQGEAQFAGVKDVAAFSRLKPLADPAGAHFRYSNVNAQLVSAVVEARAGEPLARLVRDRVFRPLCITDFDWTGDAAGHTYGYSRLYIHARDLAKLGQLVLDDGAWRGTQLIRAATMRQITGLGGGPARFAAGSYTHFWQAAGPDSVLIDDALVRRVKDAGASSQFVDGLEKLSGRTWSTAAFRAQLDTALGTKDDWWRRWYDETHGSVEPVRTRGPARVILHSGSWGQYLLIFPDTRTVVVRIAEYSHRGRETEDDRGSWGEIGTEAYRRFGKRRE